jgi:hypothetical protein
LFAERKKTGYIKREERWRKEKKNKQKPKTGTEKITEGETLDRR